jgi:regulator of RNase E activity RraA
MTIGLRIFPLASAPDANLIAALREHATSNLSDCMGRAHTAHSALRPRHRAGHLCGPALTVRTARGDNLLVHKAVDMVRPGEVIVVDAGGYLEAAIIGDIMSTLAAKRGAAGFVIDGAIRDIGAIAARDLPVYACGVTSRGPSREGPGEINGAVHVCGMVVNPGDIMVGDEDGIVAVPATDASIVLERVRALREKERELLRRIADGTIDRSWVDAALKAKGCAV